jgi:hypothetical protein
MAGDLIPGNVRRSTRRQYGRANFNHKPMNSYKVNGLLLPSLLVELFQNQQWRHPGDGVLQLLIPYLREPVDFLSFEQMQRESAWSVADDPQLSQLFHVVRGLQQNGPVELPWLDVECAVFIAVNRFPGDDIAIALDYRTDPRDPRVVASDWHSLSSGCIWQEVAESFSQFVQLLKPT